jgi:oligoribonuclease NrnB/cAMP/cGMP phosphodiesterase (DHH superfamily)
MWYNLEVLSLGSFLDDGVGILRKHFKDLNEILALTKTRMVISSIDVPVANMPYTMASDAGAIMAKGEAFSATYYDTATHRVYSLRSVEGVPQSADVSQIAKEHGGGGHKHSAGFMVKLGKADL